MDVTRQLIPSPLLPASGNGGNVAPITEASGPTTAPLPARDPRTTEHHDASAQHVSAGELREAAEALSAQLLGAGTNLQFRVDRELDRIIVSIVDSDTGQVIRQTPPEELLRLARLAREGAVSLLDDYA